MKAKRGAPIKPADERKGNALQIRLTDEERAACDEAAESTGQKLSAWARDTLVRAARRKAKPN
jgi:uncharacterized protein (DUF1778 family)